ncbi:hypothetical protein [Bradyrhizobium sp. WSM1417]|uniref:hypothetical protein n=1 Tax=Bradyrhizobium sp. WSM1417 TaxID=754500 RepID=UPI0012EB2E54|nr:hypothetical protein [Bradyrhizobium sp. WSM1417]
MAALLHACVFNDMAGIRLFNSCVYVKRPVADARITGTTLAAELCAPGSVRVVLADKPQAEADGTVGISHDIKKGAGLAPKIASIPRASARQFTVPSFSLSSSWGKSDRIAEDGLCLSLR